MQLQVFLAVVAVEDEVEGDVQRSGRHGAVAHVEADDFPLLAVQGEEELEVLAADDPRRIGRRHVPQGPHGQRVGVAEGPQAVLVVVEVLVDVAGLQPRVDGDGPAHVGSLEGGGADVVELPLELLDFGDVDFQPRGHGVPAVAPQVPRALGQMRQQIEPRDAPAAAAPHAVLVHADDDDRPVVAPRNPRRDDPDDPRVPVRMRHDQPVVLFRVEPRVQVGARLRLPNPCGRLDFRPPLPVSPPTSRAGRGFFHTVENFSIPWKTAAKHASIVWKSARNMLPLYGKFSKTRFHCVEKPPKPSSLVWKLFPSPPAFPHGVSFDEITPILALFPLRFRPPATLSPCPLELFQARPLLHIFTSARFRIQSKISCRNR